jgi:Tfp pilus assembly PilM family ATPase
VIENNRNLLEHLNLDGVALENQTKSQIRACLQGDREKTILVDIGANHTTFSMIINGVLRSSNSINIGSYKVTHELSKSLGIDDTVAEDFKKDLNLINLFTLPKQAMDFLIILKTELNMFVELNRKVNQNPNKIIFTGGGANIIGLANYFKTYPITIYFGDPLSRVTFSPEYLPYLTPLAHQLSTAIGLGLRDDI